MVRQNSLIYAGISILFACLISDALQASEAHLSSSIVGQSLVLSDPYLLTFLAEDITLPRALAHPLLSHHAGTQAEHPFIATLLAAIDTAQDDVQAQRVKYTATDSGITRHDAAGRATRFRADFVSAGDFHLILYPSLDDRRADITQEPMVSSFTLSAEDARAIFTLPDEADQLMTHHLNQIAFDQD